MKISSTQYFMLAVAALGILTALTILKLATPDILIGILVGILYAAAHIVGGDTGAANLAQGVNLGVPLSPPAVNVPAALESTQTAPAPQHAAQAGVNG